MTQLSYVYLAYGFAFSGFVLLGVIQFLKARRMARTLERLES